MTADTPPGRTMPDPRKKTVEDLFARLSARQFGTMLDHDTYAAIGV